MILHELISYEALRLIWWGLIGLLLIAFALTDGFDLGTGALLPFVARTDEERRLVIATIAPVWEGNQVWLVLGAGAIFGAWPLLYAISFSGFYLAMFLVLAALILRPVALKYRDDRDDPRWKTGWDWAIFVSGLLPALLFGVAVGNVIQGVPFHLTEDLHALHDGIWYGRFIGLLDPFSLLAGVVSLAMLVMHGGAWLSLKTEGAVQARARRFGALAGLVAVLAYLIAGLWLAFGIEGFRLVGTYPLDGPSNPLHFEVERTASWLAAYGLRPWIAIAPLLGVFGALLAVWGLRAGREVATLLASKLAIFGVISSVGLTMFPFILPSSTDPNSSLTVWGSSSSHLTLFILLVVSAIFLPLILLYTAWVYRVLWGKVRVEDLSDHGY
ncbi:MAG: cytochrome d ubiquinol oxidase subunit II [Cypionkella sp.]